MRTPKFTAAIAAATISAALVFGAAAPAVAEPADAVPAPALSSPGLPSPGLSSPGLNSPGLSLPGNLVGEKVKHGTVGGPAWSADVHTQIVRGVKVYPKRTVTIRVEVVGVNGEGKILGIGHNMPKDFKLLSVTRQSNDTTFGTGIYTLKQGEYVVTENNGVNETRLSWKEGGLLGAFQENPTVSNTKSIAVDFTYEVPDYEATFNHGPYARIGAIIRPEQNWHTGGQPVQVEKSIETFFMF